MAQATDMPAWAAVAGEENEGKGRELGGRLVLPLVPLLLARCWPRLSWLAVRCLLFALFGVSFEDSHWVNPTTFTTFAARGGGAGGARGGRAAAPNTKLPGVVAGW